MNERCKSSPQTRFPTDEKFQEICYNML